MEAEEMAALAKRLLCNPEKIQNAYKRWAWHHAPVNAKAAEAEMGGAAGHR